MPAVTKSVPASDLALNAPSLVFEMFATGPSAWTWRLRTSSGITMAEAPKLYADAAACRAAIEGMQDQIRAPIHAL